MAVYKLFPKTSSPTAVANFQRQTILRQLQSTQFKKDTSTLERTLNDFFYNKTGSNFNQYYERASSLATEAFNEAYSNYPFELNMEKMTAKFANSNIHFLNKETATLQQVKSVANEIELMMSRTGMKRDKWNVILNKIKTLQNLSDWKDVQDLNGIVASIMFGNKTAYGDAFEYPLAMFALLLDNGVDAEVDKLLDNYLHGGKRSKSYLDISHISKKDRQELKIKNSVTINDGATLEYTNPTQDKLDVRLILDDTTFNISAKSYSNIYQDIHILGGAALTVPVLNLSSVNFVSHYLTELYRNGDLQSLHEAVRLNILFTALTGAGSSTNEADTFVLNDKANRKIYVRSMPELVQYIANKAKWKYLNINNQGAEIPDQPLRNYQTRVGKHAVGEMLALMHTIKLSVSIRGTAVKSALSET